jgi:hypothetical protein
MDNATKDELINQAIDWRFAAEAFQNAAVQAAQGPFPDERKALLSRATACLQRRAELLEQVAKGAGEPAPPWKAEIAPEKDEDRVILHGFFSEAAALQGGSLIYATPKGEEVEVTGVFKTITTGTLIRSWPDMVYVGKVTKWIRDGRLDANGKHRPLRVSLIGSE